MSGRPIPSRRSGTVISRRSLPKSMREASENSTSARVASASVRTVTLVLEMSTASRTSGPISSPIDTNRIAGVIGDPDRRLEMAATPMSTSARIASDHSIRGT